MEERKISPEESLQIIEHILADARNRFYNNGFAFLFWGILIVLECIVEYCMDVSGYENKTSYVWFITFGISVIVTFWYYSKFNPKRKKSSRLDHLNGMLWIAFGINYVVMDFVCIRQNIFIAPFIFCMLGLCMFSSGAIYKFRWLYVGAVIFWLGAVVVEELGVHNILALLVCAAVMFLGYIIPGYLLWRKAKQEAHV